MKPAVWAGGLWGVRFCSMLEFSICEGAARQPQRTEPCQCVSGQPWTCNGPLKGQVQSLRCAAGVGKPELGAVAGLGRWFVSCAVLLNAEVFQLRRHCSGTSNDKTLPVCEGPVQGMPWATAWSNAASAVCSRCGGACTGCCGRAGQVVCGGCGFAECWSFPGVEIPLENHHSAQNPACV